ncbi:MAG TPA: M20 family peptidase [Candidatus Omnitrophica bacterium]|nr:M20 family peptidase [Candidatus Omnitrophota bacterium]
MEKYIIDEKSMIDLACSLISKKTINPPGDEYLTKDIIIKSMQELGLRIKVTGEEKRPNILGEIGEGPPTVAVLSHMDVVPPGENWEGNPFIPKIKGERLYGRGACDDKGPYAASWVAIKAVLEKGDFKGKIILGAVADEERGSEKGVKLLLREGQLSCDFCFIPDGGKINQAVIGEKGMLWIKLLSLGKEAHGSNPEKGINAITKMIKFLPYILKLDVKKKINPHFTPLTVNIGEIKGGEAPNIVPALCEATVDIRYPLRITKEEIIEKIRCSADSFNRKDKGAYIILKEIIQQTSPHLLDMNSFLIQTFLQAAEDVGEKIDLTTIGGNSVAKILYFAGMPSFSHSPEDIPAAHQANESVSLRNLKKCAILWANFLQKLLSKKQ